MKGKMHHDIAAFQLLHKENPGLAKSYGFRTAAIYMKMYINGCSV